jgi:surface protein
VFNQPIGSWNTANVNNMLAMFVNATAFNQPVGSWNTSNVTFMTAMFVNATAFNQPIGGWNTGSVNYMTQLFSGATAFNQPIGSWNTGNVIEMFDMFSGATAFNQPIGSWNIANVTNMAGMLNLSGLSLINYDNTLIGWAAQVVKPNVPLGAANLRYCAGAAARLVLTGATNNWVITGDVLNCTLPVKLLSFTGQLNQDKTVTLYWETTNEINNRHYEIERSGSGNNFTKAGNVNGTANPNTIQNYSYRDLQKINDIAFYRLKQVDRDGGYEYSNTILIKNTENKSISIYPNPAINELYISGSSPTISYRIVNSTGQTVLSGTAIPDKAIQLDALNKGLYSNRRRNTEICKTVICSS